MPKCSVDPKCIQNPFIPGTTCDTSVHDVLRPQPFQDSITTVQPNDFIKDDFIPEGDCQVESGSASLPDLVVLETEEQMLESG